jgi:hypothetical protein
MASTVLAGWREQSDWRRRCPIFLSVGLPADPNATTICGCRRWARFGSLPVAEIRRSGGVGTLEPRCSNYGPWLGSTSLEDRWILDG